MAFDILMIAIAIVLIAVALPIHRAVKSYFDRRFQQREEVHRLLLQHYSATIDEVRTTQRVARQQLIVETTIQSQPRNHRRSMYQSDGRRYEKVPGYVYLLCMNNEFYKIGYAKDVKARVEALQSASPYLITVVHVVATDHMIRLEAHLHGLFNDTRVTGEWFKLNRCDVEAILSIESPVTIAQLNQLRD